MRRILVVYNPFSSRYSLVRREVLEPIKKMRGVMVGKYEIRAVSPMENARKLAELLRDEDFLVVAGGDGTANVGLNAAILSKKDVIFSVFGYGDFNDFSAGVGLGSLERSTSPDVNFFNFYPLEVKINGKFWRYAGCYVTIGMLAEAAKMFERGEIREKMRKKRQVRAYSFMEAAKWYFKNRNKQEFLPEFLLNGEKVGKMTDYMAINSVKIASLLNSREWFLEKEQFLRATANLRPFFKLMKFLRQGFFREVQGEKTESETLEFSRPATLGIQAEGECQIVKNVQKVQIRKSGSYVKILR